MLRFLLAGVVAMTLTSAVLLTLGTPPDPHVRLPDRGSTLTSAAPGNGLEGIETAVGPAITYAVAVHAENVRAQAAAVEAERLRQEVESADQASRGPAQSAGSATSGTGACASGGGYDAVPRYVIDRESGGDYCVANSTGSGACGKYQIMPDTWNGYGGYATACDAPPAVQDEKAASMAPCHWSPPNYCAG